MDDARDEMILLGMRALEQKAAAGWANFHEMKDRCRELQNQLQAGSDADPGTTPGDWCSRGDCSYHFRVRVRYEGVVTLLVDGSNCIHLTEDAADVLGDALKRYAQEARSGSRLPAGAFTVAVEYHDAG